MRRRDFIGLLGGAVAAWPRRARAQQKPLPVIGWLSVGRPEILPDNLEAFRTGLNETGFIDGKNVAIEYRWEEGQDDRLPVLAAELAHRPVAVILAVGGLRPARAAKAATSTIPIVFTTQTDPVAAGLVASLSRPGGNLTGVYSLTNELGAKQLGLVRELIPTAGKIALLVNPQSPGADTLSKEIETAVRSLRLELLILRADRDRDLGEALAKLGQAPPDALLVHADIFFIRQYAQIAATAARHGIPTISSTRAFATAGGLMSYGAGGTILLRQAGLYAGRILKGENAADLPVVQATKFELVINLKTAKALALAVPPNLLALADEVIE
jgi:putative tryptophan/tyrosine transport system substrate-binding protein